VYGRPCTVSFIIECTKLAKQRMQELYTYNRLLIVLVYSHLI